MSVFKLEQERLLEAFGVAYRADSNQLMQFCVKYPDYASDFVGLAHEIALQSSLSTDGRLPLEDEAWIADACATRATSAKNPFAVIAAKKYAAIRDALGVPGVVINAFRDRLIAVATVPIEFLEDLAQELGTTLISVARYLEGPPKIAPLTSHKSDEAPEAPSEKMSFDQILQDAGVSTERRLELLGGG